MMTDSMTNQRDWSCSWLECRNLPPATLPAQTLKKSSCFFFFGWLGTLTLPGNEACTPSLFGKEEDDQLEHWDRTVNNDNISPHLFTRLSNRRSHGPTHGATWVLATTPECGQLQSARTGLEPQTPGLQDMQQLNTWIKVHDWVE